MLNPGTEKRWNMQWCVEQTYGVSMPERVDAAKTLYDFVFSDKNFHGRKWCFEQTQSYLSTAHRIEEAKTLMGLFNDE